jgi:hypothetical protein
MRVSEMLVVLRTGLLHWVAMLGALVAISACATDVVDHAFGFNAVQDSPDVQILEYQYGQTSTPSARSVGPSNQATSIQGAMKRGDFLYVKWRIKSSEKVFEDTVDLRHRLPSDITHQRVYFVVAGSQLFVYLVSPESRVSDAEPQGPGVYRNRKSTVIYPDKSKS